MRRNGNGPILLFSGFGFGEPAAAQFFFGNTREVGLEVENGCAVEHVDAAHMQIRAIAAEKFDCGQSNGIRTQWRSGRKHAVRPIVGRRGCGEFESLAAIKFPDDDQMGESLDVGEPGFEFGKDFEHAIGVVFRAETLGDVAGAFIGTTYEADGARSKHGAVNRCG